MLIRPSLTHSYSMPMCKDMSLVPTLTGDPGNILSLALNGPMIFQEGRSQYL